jgi:3-hydroxybutyryl-CoA dehydrogenase
MPIVDLERVFERLSVFPIQTFAEGVIVLSEGSRTGRLLFLVQGVVDVVKEEWHIARVAEPGAVFGDMAALRSQSHGADVLAVQRSSFIVVDDAASCLKTEPLIALYVAVVQSGRLDAANRQLIAARCELAAKGQRHRMCVAALDRIGGALRQTIAATAATSSISVTRPPAASRLSEQAVDMTVLGPVTIMPWVEIAGLLQTTNAVCATIQEETGAIAKAPAVSPVHYRFVVNRVLVPMINEAINCIYDGLAAPEDLDAMLGLGAEPAIGPLALADRIGLDVVLDILDMLHQATDDPKYQASPLLRQLVHAGSLGLKTGQGFHKYNH